MGTQVLNVSSTNSSSGGIRSYAHCTSSTTTTTNGGGSGSVTLVLINLGKENWPNAALKVDFAASAIVANDGGKSGAGTLPSTVAATRWLLTGPAGTNSSLVSLNGKLLALGNDRKLPPLAGSNETFTTVDGRLEIPRIPPESVQFIVLEGVGSLVGCKQGMA